MSTAEIFSQVVLYVAAFACVCGLVVGYVRSRSGKPLVTATPPLLVWAILLLLGLAYYTPAILAGPEAGRDS